NDQSQHYQFALTVYESLKSGDVYPSFADWTNHGFGDYGLRFYPPLTYYVLAVLRLATGDWFFASLLALTIMFFAGAVGILLWTRELFDERIALIAAALYTFIPYHLNEVYNNYLLAEFFASAILPFCFWRLDRLMRQPNVTNIMLLSAATSLLVLTHLPLTLIGGIAITVYAICLIEKIKFTRQLLCVLVTGCLTAGMTAFYWSRWLPELAWITHNTEKYFSTTWDYRTNFLLLPSHWTSLGEDVLNLWFADLMLIVAILIAIPSLIIAIKSRDRIRTLLPLIIGVAVAAAFTTPITKPLWASLGFLQRVQFPWRWLAVASMFAAVLGAFGIARGTAASREKGFVVPALTALSLAGVAFMAVLIVRTPVYVTRAALNAEIASFDESTGCDCWWPIWARPEAFAQRENVVAGDRAVNIKSWSPRERVFIVAPGSALSATAKTWYYPRWQATVNGVAIEPHPDANGALTIDVAPATSDVSLRFVEPGYVGVATMVSFFSWVIVLLASALLLVKSRGRAAETSRTFDAS
ncbi:MAG: hypothetical protein JO314_11490, partial [Acidobacteria bacterium]|nr:hypothetical protein [Acidobacteriota bacterium]